VEFETARDLERCSSDFSFTTQNFKSYWRCESKSASNHSTTQQIGANFRL